MGFSGVLNKYNVMVFKKILNFLLFKMVEKGGSF